VRLIISCFVCHYFARGVVGDDVKHAATHGGMKLKMVSYDSTVEIKRDRPNPRDAKLTASWHGRGTRKKTMLGLIH